jgi:hypothetical protein
MGAVKVPFNEMDKEAISFEMTFFSYSTTFCTGKIFNVTGISNAGFCGGNVY